MASFDLFESSKQLNNQEVHYKYDAQTGLAAIIAINSTLRGPALGGCRFIPYHNTHDATRDAMRLAQSMSFKAVMCDLPLGGGKAVIMQPKGAFDRVALMHQFARFVNELDGRYITSVDSGTSVQDMDLIAQESRWVVGHSKGDQGWGDPSPHTARGVLRGIEAATRFYMHRSDLEGLKVLIQGVGHVGYDLARSLYQAGAALWVSDLDRLALERCASEFNAHIVGSDQVYRTECDLFCPCALGGVLTADSVRLMPVQIIVGSANNQLADDAVIQILKQRNIHYVPDYVVNAGGLIQVYCAFYQLARSEVEQRIDGIYTRLIELFEQAQKEQLAPAEIVDKVAMAKLSRCQPELVPL
jgi:leucine dehydrogenase